MQFSYLQLIALAVLGNATGVFSRAIPTASQPLSQPAVSSISNPVTQNYPKQFFSENTDNWNKKKNTSGEIASVVDIDDDNTEANSNHLHRLESRVPFRANWDEYVAKGNRLYTAIGNAIRTNHQVDDEFCTFLELKRERLDSETLPPEAGAIMDSDGIPSTESGRYPFIDVTTHNDNTRYSGFFPEEQRPIAMVEKTVIKGSNPPLQMSEIAYQTAGYGRYTGNTNELHELEYIYKPLIVNRVTKSIMDQAYDRSSERGERIVFGPNTDEFKALLGTPNGAITAHMLTDHAATFHKTVTEIRLYQQRNMIVLRLG